MGWAVGDDRERERHIGYGVPAICDHPECGAVIDRGVSYACGGDHGATCGLYFCESHLLMTDENDKFVCERCEDDMPPFDPKPDSTEWTEHVLTDESWSRWRDENADRVSRMRAQLSGGAP